MNTEVLIIGGGPSGMLSAIYLNRLGISSIVLERQNEISEHPKAHELSARSIEILIQLGFTFEELKKEASDYEAASRILFGHTVHSEIGEINLLEGGNDEKYKAHLAQPEPYLNLSQTALEKIMRQKLQSCQGVKLLVGHQWESMEEQAGGLSSRVLNRDNNQYFDIQSQYLICADGAGSRSRKSLGIDMIGKDKIDDFISVYFEANLRDFLKKTAKLFWIMNPAAPGTIIAHHIEKRWVYHFPIFLPYEQKDQFTEEILIKQIKTALGSSTVPFTIKSVSLWRMTCQIADSFHQGRAFLVGDAAHRFPPTGGLGMNSGIGDVQNLCWKLALVTRGHAKAALLDTYEQERRPVIELNSKESLRNYFKVWEVPKAMGLHPKGMKWKAMISNNLLFKALPKSWTSQMLDKLQQKISQKILAIPADAQLHQKVKAVIKDQIEHFDRIGLDLGYYYERGAIVRGESLEVPAQGVSHYQPSIVPGVRFPHFWVYPDGQKKSAHNWLQPDKFTLLTNDEGAAWWRQESIKLRDFIRGLIQVENIEAVLNKQPASALVKTFYPIDKTPLLLIRPDGQVAWKPQNLDIDINAIFNQLILAP